MATEEGDRIHFGTGTCRKHRELFVTICFESGIKDTEIMEHVRMRVVAAAAHHFTQQQVVAYLHYKCVGCEHESWCVETIKELCVEEAALHRL